MYIFRTTSQDITRCDRKPVSWCVPPPVVTLSTVSGYVIPETSVYTSTNTTTVTGSVILSDSAAIQCMVAVLGTNYTATIQEYYTRYGAVARPYTSDSIRWYISKKEVLIVIILVLELMQVYSENY